MNIWWRRAIVFFLSTTILFFAVLFFSWKYLPAFIEPRLKVFVTEKIEKNFSAQVSFEEFSLPSLFPLKLLLRQTQLVKKDGSMKIIAPLVEMDVSFSSFMSHFPSLVFNTRIKIEDLSGDWARLPSTQADPIQEEKKDEKSVSPFFLFHFLKLDTSIDFQVRRSQIQISFPEKESRMNFKGTSISWRQDRLLNNQTPMDLTMQTMLEYESPLAAFSLPLSAETQELSTTPDRLKIKRLNINLGGLIGGLAGDTNFSFAEYNWMLNFQVPEISQIKVPPQFLPPGNWGGEISGQIHVTQNAKTPFYLGIQGFVRGLHGDTRFQQNDMELKGAVVADAQFDAIYQQRWKIKELTTVLDFSGADVRYRSWFQKTNKDRLRLELEAKQEGEEFKITKGDLEFSQLAVHIRGQLQTKENQSSFLTIQVPPVKLNDFERFFPFIKKESLRGTLHMNAEMRGDLSDPEKVLVTMDPLQLKSVSAAIMYSDAKNKFFMEGPFSVNADLEIRAEGRDLKSAKGDFSAELTKMNFIYEERLRKNSGEPLALHINFNQSGEKLLFDRLHLRHPAGSITFRGEVKHPQRPKLDLKFQMDDLDLMRLERFIPELSRYQMKAEKIVAKGEVVGIYDFALGLPKSELKVNAEVDAKLHHIYLPFPMNKNEKNKEKINNKEKIKEGLGTDGLLPHWPIFSQSQWRVRAQVAKIKLGKADWEKIRLITEVQKGEAKGEISIEKFFGGWFNVSHFRTPLTGSSVNAEWKMDGHQVEIQQLKKWWDQSQNQEHDEKQDENGWRGLAEWQIQASHPLPSVKDENWYQKMESKGSLKVQNFFADEINLDKKISQTLSNFGLKNIPVKNPSVKISGDLNTSFSSADKKIHFKDFFLKTPDKNELRLAGESNFDWIGYLKGELRLSQSSVGGSIHAANADPEGRLVVPIEMSGYLLDPKLTIAKATVEKMLVKTLEYEKNKILNQFDKKGVEEIKKNIEKNGKDIGNRLKELFKGK